MIYLDNAATTKPDGECLSKAKAYLTDNFYNPSALYAEGYNLHKKIEEARKNILSCVCDPSLFELTFTSCGTEADNLAVFGGARRGNAVTTYGEHSAVFSSFNALKDKGVEARFAPLRSDGSVNTEKLLSLVDSKTSLVSVIHVNNETGAINDICAIAKAVKQINKNTLFHADGVQAFGKLNFRLSRDIDMYSISAHKIGALKGTGALIKRKGLAILPIIYGGGQEAGLRSGTENVFGIKMFEFAAQKKYKNIAENYCKISEVNSALRSALDKSLFKVISSDGASPYILCVSAAGVRGEVILHEVDDMGLVIGTGSACSSNEKRRHSRVILACGIDGEEADGILRLSLNSDTSEDEVLAAARILNETVRRRREIMQ